MRLLSVLLFATVVADLASVVAPQNDAGGFELPVQLIGFPVIILAVRLSNFIKKLAYAVNPGTYQSKSKRSAFPDDADVAEVERRLIAELGENVCVYEKVCRDYAERSIAAETENDVLDWENVFRKYKEVPGDNKKFYLLSVFLGDIVASPELCHQLAKRGRNCGI
ncbi:UNVERIFIED_CONTAM: hypothetical protein PYX00_003351 [Menopon gallinae]|uniref:Uncharacterized protein n=1 Tax=Menopon gallinae TaxID=328185 RepID=A0AAW2I0P5_9NEOP